MKDDLKGIDILSPTITKEEIEEALRLSNGKRIEAARLLGMHRTTLWRLMKKFNIYE